MYAAQHSRGNFDIAHALMLSRMLMVRCPCHCEERSDEAIPIVSRNNRPCIAPTVAVLLTITVFRDAMSEPIH
jgi:hypothetical protein